MKYYADALEILLGAICKDLGYEVAITLCKKMLRETYPNAFGEEIHWKDKVSVEETEELYVVEQYFETILPAPYSRLWENQYYTKNEIVDALGKFMLTYILGTEEEATRSFLAQASWQAHREYTILGGRFADYGDILDVHFDYFHRGLRYAVDTYASRILESYQKQDKDEK